ncbi:hypothetical protein F503_02753 [Ophiostoma piceae UAMH 11346]|uniref:Fe2OG dioxygenase domain-containing protein n=1 Tax=Ophiostoma piceae (strain UAMH 11346) TaxID=1262450 RepID=S3D074_OPHP1|nr:hypothetical protein F503_02753 [Ophiostoma piceae UAMH 11346]
MSLVETLQLHAVPSLDPGFVAEPMASKPPPTFSPEAHLQYSPPSPVLSMRDLKLEDTSPISSFAATEPFHLLTPEAVLAHRWELFSADVQDSCYFPTRAGSAAMLRGMSPKYAPFIHAFWNAPEVLKIVSDLAGVDLVPVMDYEVAHTNVQLGASGVPGMRQIAETPPSMGSNQSQEKNGPDSSAAPAGELVKWHKDSYAFGGAVLLQGRYIEHVALPAINMPERITVVTSFRPKDPTLIDENSMLNVRTESQLSEMFYQWTKYRLSNLADRTRYMLAALEKRYDDNV